MCVLMCHSDFSIITAATKVLSICCSYSIFLKYVVELLSP